MSSTVILRFSFIAAMFVFAACHNEVPDLPTSAEVAKYRYCEIQNIKDIYPNEVSKWCKSTYEISKEDCFNVNDQKDTTLVLFCDSDCSKPLSSCPETP